MICDILANNDSESDNCSDCMQNRSSDERFGYNERMRVEANDRIGSPESNRSLSPDYRKLSCIHKLIIEEK